MRYKLAVAGLLWAVLTAGTVAAPQPKGLGTIGGQVLGVHEKGIAGARVTLQGAEGRRPETTVTNDQGHFWFASLPEGLYDLRAYYKGRVSEWRHNVWVSPGRQTNVTLRLRSKSSALSSISPSFVNCGLEVGDRHAETKSLNN